MDEVRDALHEMYSAEVRLCSPSCGSGLTKASLRCNESTFAPESVGQFSSAEASSSTACSGRRRKPDSTPVRCEQGSNRGEAVGQGREGLAGQRANMSARPLKEAMEREWSPSSTTESRKPSGRDARAAAVRVLLPSVRGGGTGRRTRSRSSGNDVVCGPAGISGRSTEGKWICQEMPPGPHAGRLNYRAQRLVPR